MKQTPDFARIQAKMQPGVLTLHGFLGNDTRNLGDIITADTASVHAADVTHEAIADALTRLMDKGRDIMESEVLVDGRYAVIVRDDRGVLPSPFGDGHFEKGDVSMTDRQTGASFRWNALTIHMIRDYGFYCGRGCDYRIDPEAIIQALELHPSEA